MTVRTLATHLAATSILLGCAGRHDAPLTPLPTVQAVPDEQALQILADRARSIKSVSAQCAIILTDSRGETVRLEGAVAAELPTRARFRAWKFDRTVLDILLTPDRTLVFSAQDAPRASLDAAVAGLRRGWMIVLCGEPSPGFFRSATIQQATAPGTLLARGDSPAALAQIDRATLTLRRLIFENQSAAAPFATFDQYTLIDTIPFATAVSLQSESGGIMLRLHEIELNSPLATEAFTPHPGAVERP